MDNLKWLDSRSGMKLGLENIKALMKQLGNPQNKLRFIHIGGTNGKGSTCAMTFAILRKAGYSVGMFSSPHLVRQNERIRVDDELISDADLSRIAGSVRQEVERFGCTYFESWTAIAILYFLEKKVDFVVFEVGLGGRLDSTNIVTPLVSAITNIALEHTALLGDTTRKIAAEKAGIIKPGIPVITGAEGDALEVISEAARCNDSELIVSKPSDMPTNMLGDYQKENVGLTLGIIEILRKKYMIDIPESAVKDGLRNVFWRGRMDYLTSNILVDVAHNPHGVLALKKELEKLRTQKKYKRIIILTGILKDKKYADMLGELSPFASKIIFCEAKTERAAPAEELAKYVVGIDSQIIKDVKEAFRFAQTLISKDDLLLVTGSIYMAGEVYEEFLAQNKKPGRESR
ncbi:bifunctional folylpolyglutamate synthase/dihydrofolate synthase [Candidatus Micrarchaeota archaeon]|nr:bifunctional folylpolyglutamate synthase/dihydrofolate synthase [Candidatus Micrarchaeota archaeon]